MSVDSLPTSQPPNAPPQLVSSQQPIYSNRFGFVVQVSAMALLAFSAIWGYAYWKTKSLELVVLWLNGERLLIEPTTIDLGSVPANQIIDKQIRVINLSSQDMTLFGSHESCSCLSLDEFPITLEPGTERQLSIRMSTAKDLGLFDHSVTFFTNDPKRSSTMVSISGTVQ